MKGINKQEKADCSLYLQTDHFDNMVNALLFKQTEGFAFSHNFSLYQTAHSCITIYHD